MASNEERPIETEAEDVLPRAHRQRTFKQAQAVLSDTIAIDCIIRNQTDGGARLDFGGPISLPESFRLHFVGTHTIVPVHLEWQRAFSAGVSFAGAVTALTSNAA